MSAATPIEDWLRKQFAHESGVSIFTGLVAIALGVIAVFLTFWLAYAVMWIAGEALSAVTQLLVNKKLPWPHWLRLLGAAGFIVLLSRHYLRTSPWDRGSFADADARPASGFDGVSGHRAGRGGAVVSLGQLLRYPTASSRMVIEILETGPRLLTGARGLFQQASALRRMDPAGCAWVLTFLASRTGAVPRQELVAAWPEGEWPALWAQLRLIDGLVFLEKGISLTEDLRNELRPLLTGGRN